MKVGVIQSAYIPWRGYFDLIKSCDVFVFHDDIQYTKQDWRNRNKIKTPKGLEWLTIPVRYAPVETPIDEIDIAGSDWVCVHRHKLSENLGKAPYFKDAMEIWDIGSYTKLSVLNIALIRRVCEYLGIKTEFRNSRSFNLYGAKTDRLIQIMQHLGGKTYLSGPAAKCYLDVEAMNRAGISVEWMKYEYKPYPQLHGEFEGAVTVLDLIANTGKDARNYL